MNTLSIDYINEMFEQLTLAKKAYEESDYWKEKYHLKNIELIIKDSIKVSEEEMKNNWGINIG